MNIQPDIIAQRKETGKAGTPTDNAFCVLIARGGSVRVPQKNKRLLAGRPLFMWSLEAAVNSNSFKDVWFSSDDTEMLEQASAVPGVNINRRPDELCHSNVNGIAVLSYMIEQALETSPTLNGFCMLQPTSPFRGANTIARIMTALYADPDTDMVVGVKEYAISPYFALDTSGGLTPVQDGFLTKYCHTSDAPAYVHPAGGIYAGNIQAFRENKHFYGPRSRGHVVDSLSAFDINTEDDFRIADLIAGGLS